MSSNPSSSQAYDLAREQYAALGVDTEATLDALTEVPISLHCWQGDDVGGFESGGGTLGDGLAVTGNYPGKARTPDELRQDLEKVYSLLPGKHRLNLHAFYGEFGGKKVDRDEIEIGHFTGWIDWAKQNGLGLDFNPTCFSHPKSSDGFTLSHADDGIRAFWIEHAKRCRVIGDAMGAALGSPCVTNVWIPDGYKDMPADRLAPRPTTSMPSNASCSASAPNPTSLARTNSTSATRSKTKPCSASTPATSIPPSRSPTSSPR